MISSSEAMFGSGSRLVCCSRHSAERRARTGEQLGRRSSRTEAQADVQKSNGLFTTRQAAVIDALR